MPVEDVGAPQQLDLELRLERVRGAAQAQRRRDRLAGQRRLDEDLRRLRLEVGPGVAPSTDLHRADRRELGQRVDDLGETLAVELRRVPEARHPVRELDRRRVVDGHRRLQPGPVGGSGPAASAPSEAAATARVASTARATGQTFPSRRN